MGVRKYKLLPRRVKFFKTDIRTFLSHPQSWEIMVILQSLISLGGNSASTVQERVLVIISMLAEPSSMSTLEARVASASRKQLFDLGACSILTSANLSSNLCTKVLYSANAGSRITNSPEVCLMTRLESPFIHKCLTPMLTAAKIPRTNALYSDFIVRALEI